MHNTRHILINLVPFFLMALPSIAGAYDLADPSEPWLKAKAGVTIQVPPPFEPLAHDGSKVTMWGRVYELGQLLPAQITNQSQAMFQSSPRLILVVGGVQFDVSGGTPRFGLVREDRIAFSGVSRIGPLQVSCVGWLEFDGVLRVDLTLAAEKPVTVEHVGIEFYFVPEVAKYLHAHTFWGDFDNLAVPNKVGETIQFPWRSMWWLGDDDRGLSVFTENNFDWTPENSSAVEIVRADDAIVLRFNIWSTPVELRDERHLTIGMHATPAKPLPKRWHGRHAGFVSDEAVNIAVKWHGSEKFYGYPEPKDPEAFKKEVEQAHDAGRRVCPYFTPTGISPEAAPCERHREEWLMTGAGGKPRWEGAKVDGVSHGSVSLCPVSSFTEFLTWGVEQMVKAYDIDGIYLDNAGPYPCMNATHGCGRDGKPSYPAFAYRELHKRLYTILQTAKPGHGIVWEHNSRYMVSTNLSFVDIYSDGEQFRNPEVDRHAISIENITPLFRAISFTGSQWGAQPCFLPSMCSGRIWLTSWAIAVTMPYGNVMLPAPGWMDYTLERPLLKARLDFGLGTEEVQWYRPHELPPWLQVNDDLVAGAYVRKKDNHVLLIVSNLGDKAAELNLDTAAIRAQLGSKIRVEDAATGAPSMRANSDNPLQLSVPAGTCRIFYIYPKT